MNESEPINRSRRQWEAVARTRVSKGESGTAVEAEFVNQGLDVQSARAIVDEAVRVARSRAVRLLVGSASFAALGLLVTVASYSAATSSPNGGEYLIWFGPIIVGGILSLVAVARLLNIER
jgi:hypothetical protein